HRAPAHDRAAARRHAGGRGGDGGGPADHRVAEPDRPDRAARAEPGTRADADGAGLGRGRTLRRPDAVGAASLRGGRRPPKQSRVMRRRLLRFARNDIAKLLSAPVGAAHPHPSLATPGELPVLSAFLCYKDDPPVCPWSKDEEAAVRAKLGGVTERLTKEGRLGPFARLVPTTAPPPLRKARDPPLVIDG